MMLPLAVVATTVAVAIFDDVVIIVVVLSMRIFTVRLVKQQVFFFCLQLIKQRDSPHRKTKERPSRTNSTDKQTNNTSMHFEKETGCCER
jgi:hypothetical protein